MAAVVQILKIKGAADLIMFEIENHQFGVPFFEATNVYKCVVRYWQLPKALCIDAIQMGVGGIDSWGNKPLEEHMIGAQQEANWTFQLIPSRDLKSKASTVLCNP